VTLPPVDAVILDMDGLLIDTEPVWRIAESAVFAGLGISLSEHDLLDSTGRPIDEVIRDWRRRRRPGGGQDSQVTDAEVAGRITDHVIAHVMAGGQPMPGVTAAITRFGRYRLALAIASSSPLRLIDAVCDRLGLGGIQVRCSGLDEVRAKPAPDVYLTAAHKLGVAPAGCLAMEDSPHGIAAAKAAGMRCVAVPDPLLIGDPGYGEADLVLSSLTELDDTALRLLGVRVPDERASG
jgi:mannitol-1-/sugar-/sorbitol-6-/2-deoxyglucose-6-phosphatase